MEVKCSTEGPYLPLEGMLGMSTHKGESPQKTDQIGAKMRAVPSPYRDNWSCVVGMPLCKKCLGSIPRYNPEVQKWSGRFFSFVQNVATEAGFIWLGEMGNYSLVNMERQESFLLGADTGTSKEYFWQCNGSTGRISTPKCSANSVGLTILYVFCHFAFLGTSQCVGAITIIMEITQRETE